MDFFLRGRLQRVRPCSHRAPHGSPAFFEEAFGLPPGSRSLQCKRSAETFPNYEFIQPSRDNEACSYRIERKLQKCAEF